MAVEQQYFFIADFRNYYEL